VNVAQGRSNRCDNFQLQRSKFKVTGRQKPLTMAHISRKHDSRIRRFDPVYCESLRRSRQIKSSCVYASSE